MTFDGVISDPLTKGITQVYNSGSVSGTGFTTFSTGTATNNNTPTQTAVDRAPMVAGVFVRGSAWAPGYLTALQTAGLGSSTFGYQIPTGANQLATLPWTNLDRVSVRFTENVNVAAGDLQVLGANVPTYALNAAGFSYDAATFTATWALTAPVAADKLRLVLNSANVTQVNPTNAADRKALDGEWIDGTATGTSGDGSPGGNFAFQVNVQPGDVDNSGGVNTSDLLLIRQAFGTTQALRDVNGDAAIDMGDYNAARGLMFSAQPAGNPGGTPGSGWVAATAPTPPTPGPAGTTVTAVNAATLLTDLDGDAQADPGDTVRYTVTIVNNGAAASNVVLTAPLDTHMSLVNNSVVIAPDSAPTLTALESTPIAFTENGAATAVTSTVVVGDADDTMLTGATVQITGNYQSGADVLAFANQNGITGSFNATNGTMTLTGTTTLANYQTALRAVTYQNTSDNPSTLQRTLTFLVTDGLGTSSTAVTRAINVTAVNDAPTLTSLEGTALTFTEDDPATAVTSTISSATWTTRPWPGPPSRSRATTRTARTC
ncbi:MAG TPA: hypothetical protein VGF55_24650 [Gemmataceae bacterium]